MVRSCLILLTLLAITDPLEAQKNDKPDRGPGTTTAARKFLEGRWSLLSFDVYPPGKDVVHVTGGQGTLTYDDFGNLQVEIRVPEDIREPLRLAGVPTDKGVLSIKGRTVIDMQKRTLTYFLEGQKPFGAPSGPLALNRQRHWEVEGQTLTLTTNGEDGKPISVGKWQKVP